MILQYSWCFRPNGIRTRPSHAWHKFTAKFQSQIILLTIAAAGLLLPMAGKAAMVEIHLPAAPADAHAVSRTLTSDELSKVQDALAQSQAQVARYQKLYQQGLVSQQALEDTKAQVINKQTAVNIVQAQLALMPKATEKSISPTDAQQELSQAQSELARRESDLAQSTTKLGRAQELSGKGLIAGVQLQQAQQESDRNKAAVDEGKALVAQAQQIVAAAQAEAAKPKPVAIQAKPMARSLRPELLSRAGLLRADSNDQVMKLGLQLIRNGYQAQFAIDLAAVIKSTGAVITSTFRSGAVVRGKGVPSMHSLHGGAIDIQGPDPELIAAELRQRGWKALVEYPGFAEASPNLKAPIVHVEFRHTAEVKA
jgi:multidrug resistance efflux pump